MRFEVKLGSEIIGFSELENGDPPREPLKNSAIHRGSG
jgi:hypothetical protein